MKRNSERAFNPSSYPDIPPRHGFVYRFTPPGLVRVRGNVDGDTMLVDTAADYWRLIYGGEDYSINWRHPSLANADSSLMALWRHHLAEAIQQKSPPTVRRKFGTLLHNADDLHPDLTLSCLLRIFARLRSHGDRGEFHFLRAFYNWGIAHEIPVFDRQVQIIINNLPTPPQSPYASIFLQQNYVTPAQEALILRDIDASLGSVEELPVAGFDADQFVALRDATLRLLVWEIAPRPLQVYMLARSDIHEVPVGDTAYNSLRMRRNKSRFNSEKYTTPREISVRLGKALNKLLHLNERLFDQQPTDDAPVFLASAGTRLTSGEISSIISAGLRRIFGDDGLDVEGALTPFRHHLGQSLADQGAPPEVISDRLGHSSLVAARAYITATPEIAKIKTRALGENNTYQEIMSSLMTGTIIRRNQVADPAMVVRGTVGLRYITGIGGCDVRGHCQFDPIYSCYECRKFHPFTDGPHQEVLDALKEQAALFIDTTEDLKHSRPVIQLERVIEAVKVVQKECDAHERVDHSKTPPE